MGSPSPILSPRGGSHSKLQGNGLGVDLLPHSPWGQYVCRLACKVWKFYGSRTACVGPPSSFDFFIPIGWWAWNRKAKALAYCVVFPTDQKKKMIRMNNPTIYTSLPFFLYFNLSYSYFKYISLYSFSFYVWVGFDGIFYLRFWINSEYFFKNKDILSKFKVLVGVAGSEET